VDIPLAGPWGRILVGATVGENDDGHPKVAVV
jgi:hypothetical protein